MDVANTQSRDCMPMECSWMSTNQEPSPKTWTTAETSNSIFAMPPMLRLRLKSNALLNSAQSTNTDPTRLTLPEPCT